MCNFGKSLKALLQALSSNHYAVIRWPSLEEQAQWGKLVSDKNNLVTGRWGFIDGKNYYIQKPSAADIQNACYNGWLHATLVAGCFCFGVNGTICWGNVVGSWNDEISRPFQVKLCNDEINLPNHGILSDSAFPEAGNMFNRIITPLKDGELERHAPELRAALLAMSSAITSMGQSAEWGMGAVEKCYRRLLLPLPFNPMIRELRLLCIYRLYNYRVRTTNISQISSYFFDS